MNGKFDNLIRVPICALALVGLGACSDPTGFDSTPVAVVPPEEEEICAASSEWLPNTPTLDEGGQTFLPLPHPSGECPFYRGVWNNFLVATQPLADGRPTIQDYPTIDDAFQSVTPHDVRGTAKRAWLGDIKQAGGRQILIDQNGKTIYYGIHVNPAYVDFINENKLQTAEAIKAVADNPAQANLFFPSGLVEFKSAWQEIDENDPAVDDYITTKAWVPHISQTMVDGKPTIIENKNTPREITVRLLALHVVYTLPGHPEFIWGTMEHTEAVKMNEFDTSAVDNLRDVAPIDPRDVNPTDADPLNQNVTEVMSDKDHVLYRAGTPGNVANTPIPETELVLDEASQTFRRGTDLAQTSIYRMYPASKSNTTHADDAIASLNHNVEALFKLRASQNLIAANDKRGHYRLVGAQWLDKPRFFEHNVSLQNDKTSPLVPPESEGGMDAFNAALAADGSDSDLSMTAGEDRLSSTAMESFTQGPAAFPNCFACHNTQAITAKGVPTNKDSSGIVLLKPSLLNVSHVLSQFILEESEAAPAAP